MPLSKTVVAIPLFDAISTTDRKSFISIHAALNETSRTYKATFFRIMRTKTAPHSSYKAIHSFVPSRTAFILTLHRTTSTANTTLQTTPSRHLHTTSKTKRNTTKCVPTSFSTIAADVLPLALGITPAVEWQGVASVVQSRKLLPKLSQLHVPNTSFRLTMLSREFGISSIKY